MEYRFNETDQHIFLQFFHLPLVCARVLNTTYVDELFALATLLRYTQQINKYQAISNNST